MQRGMQPFVHVKNKDNGLGITVKRVVKRGDIPYKDGVFNDVKVNFDGYWGFGVYHTVLVLCGGSVL